MAISGSTPSPPVTTPPPVVTTTRPEPTPDPNGIIVDPCGDGKVYQGYSIKEGSNDWGK